MSLCMSMLVLKDHMRDGYNNDDNKDNKKIFILNKNNDDEEETEDNEKDIDIDSVLDSLWPCRL